MAIQANYDLLKYSRSYPPNDPARLSNQLTGYDSEWQHFPNPKLHLFLEGTSPDADGSFRSAKVRIIWELAGSRLQHAKHETAVVLEDIDLSSFPPAFATPQKTPSQSLPLKVVYRDSVVGFRYVHPRVLPAGTLPTYRRFQICFTDTLLATRFVDSIRRICPCKPSHPLAIPPPRTIAATAHTHPTLTPRILSNKASTPAGASSIMPQTPNSSTRALATELHSQAPHMRSPIVPTDIQSMQYDVDGSEVLLSKAGAYLPQVAALPKRRSLQMSQNTGAPLVPSMPSIACSLQKPEESIENAMQNHRNHSRLSCSTTALYAGISDPTSSTNSAHGVITSSVDNVVDVPFTTSSTTCSNDSTEKAPSQHNTTTASQVSPLPDCLRNLCTTRELCALPLNQLEQLVGEVIREPEFISLLEKLDTMWKVKALMTRIPK